jgi:hypothetical protein
MCRGYYTAGKVDELVARVDGNSQNFTIREEATARAWVEARLPADVEVEVERDHKEQT